MVTIWFGIFNAISLKCVVCRMKQESSLWCKTNAKHYMFRKVSSENRCRLFCQYKFEHFGWKLFHILPARDNPMYLAIISIVWQSSPSSSSLLFRNNTNTTAITYIHTHTHYCHRDEIDWHIHRNERIQRLLRAGVHLLINARNKST